VELKASNAALSDEIAEKRDIIDAADEYYQDKDSLDAGLVEQQGKIDETNSTIAGLDTQIGEKQAELDRLTGEIVKAAGAPFSIPSGQYTGGTDIGVGRYSVSGSSNFVVRSNYGDLKVNTILGDRFYGDYVCTIAQGDRIECSSSTTWTPVQ
jgi:hypothetical protein